MGGAMARRLIEAGHDVAGCDIDAQAIERLVARGGRCAMRPADAAAGAAIVVVMVHDAVQVERVLFGADGVVCACRPGTVVWLASTVTPFFARSLAPRLGQLGLLFVDGPVSGGATGAEAGALTVIAGGDTAALEACRSAMEACASQVFRVGDAGAGSTVKMINQVLVAAHIALTAEAVSLAVAAGVQPQQLINVITHSAGSSKMFEKRAPRIATGDHTPHSTLDTFLKDLGIALESAGEFGSAMPMAAAAHGVFAAAAADGHGRDSDTLVVRAYEHFRQCRPVEPAR